MNKIMKRITDNEKDKKKTYHGGAFFDAIGEDFSTLENIDEIISADVLDAWFPPSPKVIQTIQEYLPFLLKTSPPTHGQGLIKTIAKARGVSPDNVLIGAGSSAIMFTIFPQLFDSSCTIAVLDPMYGEYIHIAQQLTNSKIATYMLSKEHNFRIDTTDLDNYITTNKPDCVIIVNPNSPTGQMCPAQAYKKLISKHSEILFVVDETYIEYIGTEHSLEQWATQQENIIIIKSMSKAYALSGARVAYMIAHSKIVHKLAMFVPPWAVSLPGQIAGVYSLQDTQYYQKMYQKTHDLRLDMEQKLQTISFIKIYPTVANFVLIELLDAESSAQRIVEQLRKKNIFIRNCSSMSTQLGDKFLRISVKDKQTNNKVISALKEVCK